MSRMSKYGGSVFVTSVGDEAKAKAMCHLLSIHKIPAHYRMLRHERYPEDCRYTTYCIDVKDPDQLATARDLWRGFQAGMKVQGDVAAFVAGVTAAIQLRSEKPDKLPTSALKALKARAA